MSKKKIVFSPVTRLSGLLSVDVIVDRGKVVEADVKGTMFRGFEWIMRDHKVTDAVYLTQRVCGICSLAHGAVASYLLDELYDNQLTENAQLLRNIMFAVDFLQNHIRHFYLFSLPDFVLMPERPPFHGQRLKDARLNWEDNQRLVDHYFAGVVAGQESHELLALFGGKAPNQHSFLHGGVAVAPTADKINRALALVNSIRDFVKEKMVPDTRLLARAYSDYYQIGVTPQRLISFGLFRFGPYNEEYLLQSGVLFNKRLEPVSLDFIAEEVVNSYFVEKGTEGDKLNEEIFNGGLRPEPDKSGAYTWIKTVLYNGQPFETGPLARSIINGLYSGGTSTMDRIMARSMETLRLTKLIKNWLQELVPGPPPIKQKKTPVKSSVVATTDAMRGALLHSAVVEDERVIKYNIITPTTWNFSPKDRRGQRGPVENALVGTEIAEQTQIFTVLGRIIRSFDPCISCATHVLDLEGKMQGKTVY